jgi:ABC-type Fe3+ transport system permease subunit
MGSSPRIKTVFCAEKLVKNWLFSETNFFLFGLSAVLLAIGYILLGQGPADNHLSKSVAPIILVFVYCGLIPFAMLYGYGKGGENGKETKK